MPRPRHASGSALVYVIAGVAVASLVAAGYLQLTSAGRSRSTRELQATVNEMDLEERVLRIKRSVEKQAGDFAVVNLPAANAAAFAGAGQAFRLQTADGATDEIGLAAFAPGTFGQAGVDLGRPGDPFSGARAIVQSLQLHAESAADAAAVPDRDITKQVAEAPQIDVRQIPVSQFTLFAASGANRLSAQDFSGELGRVYSRGDLVVDGAPDLSFPLLSAGRLQLTDGARFTLGSDAGGATVVVPSGFDSADPQFPAEARTELGSRVITPQSLPLSADLAPSTHASANAEGAATLNLDAFAAQCSVAIRIRRNPGQKARLSGNAGFQVDVVDPSGRLAGREPRAIQVQERNGEAVVALDYRAFHLTSDPLALVVRVDGAPGSIPNARVLVRGADRLAGDLSVVSPHPLVLSGDFNAAPANGAVPAASLVTSRDVRAEGEADAQWAQAAFGPP